MTRRVRLELESLEDRITPSVTANNDMYLLMYGTPFAITDAGLLGNDTGSSLSASLVSQASHGTATVNSDGTFEYEQTDLDFAGNDTFTYQATDGTDSDTATVTLNIPWQTTSVDLAVSPSAMFYYEDEEIEFTATVAPTLYVEDAPTPTGNVVFTDILTSTTLATVSLNANGVASFSTASLTAGSYSITAAYAGAMPYTGSSDNAYLTIYENTTPTLDPIDAIDDQFSAEGDEIDLDLSTLAYDPDSQTLTYSATGLPTGLSINASTGVIVGTIAFTAGETNEGVYEVEVTVTDSSQTYDSQTFTWTVAPLVSPIDAQTWELDSDVWLPLDIHNPNEFTLTFSATDLPSGLTIDEETGLISGVLDEYASGTATITIDSGDGEDIITFDWAIVSVPVVITPGEQWSNVNAALEFSTVEENAFSVESAYGSETVLSINLAVNDGTLTLAQTTGLTFLTGDGTNDAALSFTGTIEAINAALDGLTFTPTTDFRGEAIVTVEAIDEVHLDALGEPLTGYGETGITIGGPVILVPTETQATNSSQPFAFSWSYGNGIYIIDPPAGEEGLQVDLEIDDGTITLGSTDGLTFITGDGEDDAVMSFTGLLDDINRALEGMFYTPSAAYVGEAVLDITATDLGSGWASGNETGEATVTVDVGGPSITVPDAQWTTEDTALEFSTTEANAITVANESGSSANLEITLSAGNGTLTLAQTTGLTFATGDGTNDEFMAFNGSATNINAALDGLTFTPTEDFLGEAWIDVYSEEAGGSWQQAASAWASIVVGGPVIAIDDNITTDEDTSVVVSVLNNDSSANGPMSIEIADGPSHGTVTIDDSGTPLDTADDRIEYTPEAEYNGEDVFTYEVTDAANNTAIAQVCVTIEPVDDAELVAPIAIVANEGDAIEVAVATRHSTQSITFSATGLPGGLTIDSNTGVISGIVGYAAAETNDGLYEVEVTATSSETQESSGVTFNCYVSATNRIDWIDDLVVLSGSEVELQIVATDNTESELSYDADGLPTGLSIDSETGVITGSVTVTEDSIYTIDVSVTDGATSDMRSFDFTVLAGTDPRVIFGFNDTISIEDDFAFLSSETPVPVRVTLLAPEINDPVEIQLSLNNSERASLNNSTLTLSNGGSSLVYMTPLQLSQEIDDLVISALLSAEVIGSVSASMGTVMISSGNNNETAQRIRSSTSPSSMTTDRIPPRVTTPYQIRLYGALRTTTTVTLAIFEQSDNNGRAAFAYTIPGLNWTMTANRVTIKVGDLVQEFNGIENYRVFNSHLILKQAKQSAYALDNSISFPRRTISAPR